MSSSLSPIQLKAAQYFDGPLCILAGAGSGKTRVITHRIAHLIENKGIPPWNILGVTFTNKAAREMRERVELLVGEDNSNKVLLGTFHGLAVRFLRRFGEHILVPQNFLIYDEDDVQRLIKRIIKENYQLTKQETTTVLNKILHLKRQKNSQPQKFYQTKEEKLYEAYLDEMKRINALDFDNLLVKFLELLENASSFEEISKRARHILVDEYQDVNLVQSKIIKLLAKNADSVAIVGDDDQSIYGWRGANAGFMSDFIDYFKNTELIKLEENYRSTTPILESANCIIQNNQERLGKNLKSYRGDGALINLKKSYRDTHEANLVVEKIINEYKTHNSNYSVAILIRTNSLSRPLEEAMYRAGIPYRLVGGMKFYDRKEVKDVLAAARALTNLKSDVDILRVLDSLPLGIGRVTYQKILEYGQQYGLGIFEVMSNSNHLNAIFSSSTSKKKIDNFVHKLTHIKNKIAGNSGELLDFGLNAAEAISLIIESFGFITALEKKNDEESLARIANIEQLIQAANTFVQDAQQNGNPVNLESFLESVALFSSDDSVGENKKQSSSLGTVTIMTLHAAKGLEFDAVFLVGMEEGTLPHARCFSAEDVLKEIEEERRLVYVGFTRAKSKLFLSYCQERFLHGKVIKSTPSRFLKEIPEQYIAKEDVWLLQQIKKRSTSDEICYDDKPLPSKSTFDMADVDFSQDLELKVGSRVYHKIFQAGKVLEIIDGMKPKAKILFFSDRKARTIVLSHLQY